MSFCVKISLNYIRFYSLLAWFLVWFRIRCCCNTNGKKISSSVLVRHFQLTTLHNIDCAVLALFLTMPFFMLSFIFFSRAVRIFFPLSLVHNENEAYLTVNVYCLCLHFNMKMFPTKNINELSKAFAVYSRIALSILFLCRLK